MSPLPATLFGLAVVSAAAGMLAIQQALPRFRALERRGLVRGPIPEMARGANLTWARLLWGVSVPADSRTLRRLILFSRASQILAPLFLFAALFAMSQNDARMAACAHQISACESREDRPPPLRLEIKPVESAR